MIDKGSSRKTTMKAKPKTSAGKIHKAKESAAKKKANSSLDKALNDRARENKNPFPYQYGPDGEPAWSSKKKR